MFRWTGSWLTIFTTPDPVASEQITDRRADPADRPAQPLPHGRDRELRARSRLRLDRPDRSSSAPQPNAFAAQVEAGGHGGAVAGRARRGERLLRGRATSCSASRCSAARWRRRSRRCRASPASPASTTGCATARRLRRDGRHRHGRRQPDHPLRQRSEPAEQRRAGGDRARAADERLGHPPACPCGSSQFPQADLQSRRGCRRSATASATYLAFRHALLRPLPGETELTAWRPGAERRPRRADGGVVGLPRRHPHLLQRADRQRGLSRHRAAAGERQPPGPAAGLSAAAGAGLERHARGAADAERPPADDLARRPADPEQAGPGQQPQVFEVDLPTTIGAPDMVVADVVPSKLPLLDPPPGSTFWLAGKVAGIKPGDRLLLANVSAITAQTLGDYVWIKVAKLTPGTDPLGNTITQVTFTTLSGSRSPQRTGGEVRAVEEPAVRAAVALPELPRRSPPPPPTSPRSPAASSPAASCSSTWRTARSRTLREDGDRGGGRRCSSWPRSPLEMVEFAGDRRRRLLSATSTTSRRPPTMAAVASAATTAGATAVASEAATCGGSAGVRHDRRLVPGDHRCDRGG